MKRIDIQSQGEQEPLTAGSEGLPASASSLPVPDAILAQGEAAVSAYLAHLDASKAVHPLNRVRVNFLGYGDAGKTSLIRVLFGEPVVAGTEPMTPGIDIREWPVPGTNIIAHFWDFGGQVMVHATHQLFLRDDCLYVLVISARSEITATEQAEYWLEQVKSFGGNSTVLIVGNRVDQAELNINMASLRQKYPDIAGYFPLSCTGAKTSHQSHFAAFYDEFCQQLRAQELHQVMFTAPQFGVLQGLRRNPASFLSKGEFDALCEQYQISEQGIINRDQLLDILDKLGTITHFPDLPFIDGYVLNPRWLTYGIYTLMYARQSHLSQQKIVALLGNQPVQDAAGNSFTYSPAQCRLIMDAMLEFRLCYSLPDQPDTLIIPALLPANQPDFRFDKSTALTFEFVFSTFLPRHIFPEFIAIRHREIFENKVWQSGVCLKHGIMDAQALVQVDYHARQISLLINGSQARDYLTVLRDDIQTILARITIDYQEWVVLPASTRLYSGEQLNPIEERAPYRQLMAFAGQHQREYISATGLRYDVSKVLHGFIPDVMWENQANLTNFVRQNVAKYEVINSFNPVEIKASAVRRKLPIGIQTFSQIIEGGYYYVDKTAQIANLVVADKYYFLSRPRRFGKSLLLDTIKELFECNEPLFRGFAIHESWNWHVSSPVIRISFNDGGVTNRSELERRMLDLLSRNSERLQVTCSGTNDPVQGFAQLIRRTHAQYGQRAVILVDEYDKPILDHINAPAIALEMRECLKGFYSVIKDADANISFAIITGVSKFSKVSLFSGLNNLRDITVSPEYSALCGYTDADIDTVFEPELMELDRSEIRHWYNGYNWLGDGVYNPFDVLLLFRERKFRPYWFESATPTFLIKLLTEREEWLPNLGKLKADAKMLSTFDVDTIPTTALMFQAGYLTIDQEVLVGGTYYYQMRFPNREVEQSLYDSLLQVWTGETATGVENKLALYDLLERNDLPSLKNLFQAFYSSIPHQWYGNNPIAKYEGHYASVFYTYFVATGLEVRVEDATSLGRIDMTVRFGANIYLFEFKVVATTAEGNALQQIKDKRYADKYRAEGGPIYMIGVEFSRATRNVVGFDVEQVPA